MIFNDGDFKQVQQKGSKRYKVFKQIRAPLSFTHTSFKSAATLKTSSASMGVSMIWPVHMLQSPSHFSCSIYYKKRQAATGKVQRVKPKATHVHSSSVHLDVDAEAHSYFLKLPASVLCGAFARALTNFPWPAKKCNYTIRVYILVNTQ